MHLPQKYIFNSHSHFVFDILSDVCFLQFTRSFAITPERLQYYIGGVGPNDYNIT